MATFEAITLPEQLPSDLAACEALLASLPWWEDGPPADARQAVLQVGAERWRALAVPSEAWGWPTVRARRLLAGLWAWSALSRRGMAVGELIARLEGSTLPLELHAVETAALELTALAAMRLVIEGEGSRREVPVVELELDPIAGARTRAHMGWPFRAPE